MKDHVDVFHPTLREAIAEARLLGLKELADQLENSAFAAYTTSSELLGETGQAIVGFINAAGNDATPSLLAKLHFCLEQVQVVWPQIRVQR